MKLADYQQILSKALHADENFTVPFSLSTNSAISSNTRLNVYRNSIIGGRLAALRQIFPSVEKLIGEICFQQLAEQFIARYPSTNIRLNAMGAQYVAFIQDSDMLQEVPYLAEMAQFEWLWHQVFHGPTNQPINYDQLAIAIEQAGENIQLQRPLGARAFSSFYPLDKLWEMCQPEYQGDFVLQDAEYHRNIVLLQREQRIHIEILKPNEWQVWQQLAESQSLHTLCANFEQEKKVLLPEELLPQLYARGLVIVS